ncbi:Bgt-51225 [Blumeria graminis f. sp. tritici]|uniref:Bgt-51225 n=1 Tax=Blumeria graminis f. sp. tritici TaxID=62690 RepID=A0A9X9MIW5_BLUGR|nr:Bgt-51225 [Blumeria graminis f. sp. tritici]
MHPLHEQSKCLTELSSYIVAGEAGLLRVVHFECRACARHE